MRKLINPLNLVALLIAFASFNVQAKDSVNIGYVDIAKIMLEAPQAEGIRKKLEEEFAPRQRDLRNKQKSLKESEEKLARDAAIMSETELSRAERDLVQAKRDFRRDREEFNEDVNIRKSEELGDLQRVIRDTVSTVAKKRSFDLVIVNEAVAYSSERVDLTDDVLTQLKKK